MEKTEFRKLAEKTKLKDKAINLAEMVLVDGLSSGIVAKQNNVSRQLVDQATNRILRELTIFYNSPREWRAITTILPEPMIEVIKWIEGKEREKEGLIVKSKNRVPDLSASDVELLTEMIGEWRKTK
ncbi:hypothetical protein BHECKSOX_579 [Bathymodiolus heckerae thiotrophic gill symbiont]|uniref:TrfB-related DNA-binding protein n=1 Tax=Bathymodiolus heckerae thiotrophic gill symbiont TaxID=1052212 RepID=UPI0010B9C7B8|nr:TrfB-related DNA-binding protein [Bathymodiolus heckerae thiotrophic gill symbiont]SHN92368.1 hypothetical protein BHECKSOX_579 [Bathymodiolus heckerae thiotrophic gill symbiont]